MLWLLFLANDRVKLLAYRILIPLKQDIIRFEPKITKRTRELYEQRGSHEVTLLRRGSMHRVKSEKGDPKIDRRDPGGWRS